jgi:P-type Ca2+ transporter type 2C
MRLEATSAAGKAGRHPPSLCEWLVRDLRQTVAVTAWHALPAEDVAQRLSTDQSAGLSSDEAARRLGVAGPNRLAPVRRATLLKELGEELTEPMILLLLAVGILYSVWGKAIDAVTIFAVIFMLVAVEAANEWRAKRAITALASLAAPRARVRRDGRLAAIPRAEVVPGDVLVLRAGDQVAADARLFEAAGLAVDESALTGEPVPVAKDAATVQPEQTAVADRAGMVYAGVVVVRGRATAVVVATGGQAEIGRVAALAGAVRPPRTPLQRSMGELTKALVWAAAGFSVLVPVLGVLLAGQMVRQMVLTGLSLAFATIPEEMPLIIMMVLGVGGLRLARRHAVVEHLQSVETLGCVTVIATDKTGTLTENRLRVAEVLPAGGRRDVLTVALLAQPVPDQAAPGADPIEVALREAAATAGAKVTTAAAGPLLADYPFDPGRQLSSVVRRDGEGWRAGVLGAPEAVLARCRDCAADAVLEEANRLAGRGLRVLAVAAGSGVTGPFSRDTAESGLRLAGLVAFEDPVRPDARDAVALCGAAGIRTVIVTGDHPRTAAAIAGQLNLHGGPPVLGPDIEAMTGNQLAAVVESTAVFARVAPAHKLRVVQALQRDRQVVAVTGDGVNDAPALAAADIGVAMGLRGTDVARQAADIILTDDAFATITHAIAQGRLLFANLRKGVRYYLACKTALVLATLLPVLLGRPVPIAPVQIIVMELFMDLAASAAFVNEVAEDDLMRLPPRDPRTRFLDRSLIGGILAGGAGLFAAVSTAYLTALFTGAGTAQARTVAFVTWLLGHVLLAAVLRTERRPLREIGITTNPVLLAWAAATLVFIAALTTVPAVRDALHTTSLPAWSWALATGTAAAGTGLVNIYRWWTARRAAT